MVATSEVTNDSGSFVHSSSDEVCIFGMGRVPVRTVKEADS